MALDEKGGKIETSDDLAKAGPSADLTHIPPDPSQNIPPDSYIRGIIQQELLKLVEARIGAGTSQVSRLDRNGLYFGSEDPTTAVLKILLNGKLKVQLYDYGGGTTGGPESDTDLENGMIYIAANFGGAGTHKLRARIGGAWKEATLA